MRSVIGVVLLNLGGPDEIKSVSPFLYNLFSDRQIIKLGPQFLQKPIAKIISTFRAKKTKAMYGAIGGGSPILPITIEQASELENSLNSSTLSPHSLTFKVYVGMRYWYPFIKDTVKQIYEDGIRKIVALSLYPHYSITTTGSAFAELVRTLKDYPIQCFPVRAWPENHFYVDALLDRVQEGLNRFDKDGHILFSAHSLPVSFIKNGDPYVDELNKTIRQIRLKLPKNIKCHLSYQSKSGPVKWLEPSTEEMIRNLSSNGAKHVLVIPISFVSDHIETLYEIDILYKDFAKKHGIILDRIESLNTHPLFIEALKSLVLEAVEME